VNISIYTVVYSPEQLEQAATCLVLDNTRNERPDWREYWPIRHFLLTHPLEDDRYYGFFSPRFAEKTGLSTQQVIDFILASPPQTDAVLFSPQVDVGAFFPNVFVGEDQADPGFLETCQRFVNHVGLELDLSSVVMDSSTIVFSNYIVARTGFWRVWFALAERLYEIAEQGTGELRDRLVQPTNYREGVQRKVFLMERLASLILVTNPGLRTRAFNPFVLAWSMQLHRFRDEAIICDALKIAARRSDFPEYRALYEKLRQRVILSALAVDTLGKLRSDPLAGTLNSEVLGLLPASLRCIAEIGAENKQLSRAYCDVNKDTEWISLAASILRGPEQELAPNAWDACILDGILERQADPAAALASLKTALTAGGVLVATFQNAQHWRYQARLALGDTSTHPAGEAIGDRRFTRAEVFRLLDQCGYRVDTGVARVYDPPEAARYLANIRSMALLSGGDPDTAAEDARILQYVVRAVVKR